MAKLEKEPLFEQIFGVLKDQIRSGYYKKGDKLPSEKELMDSLGVSRVTVRQALKLLSDTGIVETRKGKGSIVAIDWKSLMEPNELHEYAMECFEQFRLSTDARRVIEPAIAKQAAVMAEDEDIRRLELSYENDHDDHSRKSMFHVDPERRLTSFHAALWMTLKNPMLDTLWNDIVVPSDKVHELPLIIPSEQEETRNVMREQHRNILNAIRAHDPEYAYFHMLVHCDWVSKTFTNYFERFFE